MKNVHVTTHDKTHKLAGFQSISTSGINNPICAARRNDTRPGAICPHCYAAALEGCYSNLGRALERNREILTAELLTADEAAAVPVSTTYARIESFGDVANVTQARNYVRIIAGHPLTRWGIWTKNPGIWAAAFRAEGGKPENCTFGISSCLQGVDIPDESIPEVWRGYVDFVFICHDPEAITAGGPEAVRAYLDMTAAPGAHYCAGVFCRDCLACYTRPAGGEIKHVHELTRTAKKANKAARAEIELARRGN